MSEKLLYLKEEAYFEPLVNNWYAWAFLIPPLTCARYVDKTHRRIMKSFVNNYRLHIMASKESALTGGEFVSCTEEQVQDIKSLIEDIEKGPHNFIELSNAIKELESELRNHVNGESIEYLYSKVPEMLRGFVEIFLDLEHKPSYRVIEPLVYASELYNTDVQKSAFGLVADDKERGFVFSTPRLPDADHIHVNLELKSEVLDRIFASRTQPMTESEIEEIFGSLEKKGGLDYRALFTETPPDKSCPQLTDGIRLEYLGHAGFLVQSAHDSILIDPMMATLAPSQKNEAIRYCELPEQLDYILLTHAHSDHYSLETLIQLRHKTNCVVVPKNNGGTLADPSMKLSLKQLGFNVIEVDDMEVINLKSGTVTSIPFLGEHGDLNIRSKSAWLIETQGKKLYFGADSSNPDCELFEHIRKSIGSLDYLFIGMECVGAPYTWSYGALHTQMVSKSIKNSRRLNGSDCKQALGIIDKLTPDHVYIYALGMEPWYKYLMGIEYDDESTQIVESNELVNTLEARQIEVGRLYGKKQFML
ncbi:MBL fold metallo-hydrolase [Pseudoalteromonas umbrosa]|uniref:MBL fold metallo-hydrolase n=1 Tax=Pseudoalteromonas umbrosa TaxID=3048489 RepID=UPI0024C2FE76|nr:MBL fold metallo-hydrolase [Pseudoalteromonas sp. B95]MDK1287002.1 MBL fold metallo-hydrolase [Pseudoalteromonas sp. B95]